MSSEVKPIVWTIMHPDIGGPLNVVAESAYQALVEKCAALEAERDDARCVSAGIEEQAQKNSAYDDWRIEQLTKERDKLAERVKELEGKLNTDTICPVCCEGYQGADKIGVQELKDANYKYYNENKTLKAQNKILRDAVEHTNEFCLCERFKTMGFDYNEDHKNKGRAKMGGRWLTPRDVTKSALAAINKGEN